MMRIGDTPKILADVIERLEAGEDVGGPDVELPDEIQLVATGGLDAASRPPVFAIHGGNGNSPFGGAMADALTLRRLYAVVLSDAAIEAGNAHPEGFAVGIAQYYVRCIQAVQPDGPYTLSGPGSGSVIAFEMARELEATGFDVSAVVVLDFWLPTGADANYRVLGLPRHIDPEMFLITEMLTAQNVPEATWPDMKAFRSQLDRAITLEGENKEEAFLIRRDAVETVVSQVFGPVVAEVLRKALTGLRPIYGSGHTVTSRRKGRKLDAPIYVVKADDNSFVLEALRRFGRADESEDYGWSAATTGGVRVMNVPGNHVNMTTLERGAKAIAAIYTTLGLEA